MEPLLGCSRAPFAGWSGPGTSPIIAGVVSDLVIWTALDSCLRQCSPVPRRRSLAPVAPRFPALFGILIVRAETELAGPSG